MVFLKKIGRSFLKFVLMTALLHILVLVLSAIKNMDLKYLNYFQILGLAEFWPKITQGWISDLISLLVMLGVIVTFLALSRTRKVNQ